MAHPSPSHVCRDSGGAHHFHADENGVRLCSCGELETSVDDELAMIEQAAPLPADRARRLYARLDKLFPELDIDVDALVNRVERPES